MNLDYKVIKLIQNNLYQNKSYLNHSSKFISGRKYRKAYLCLSMIYFIVLFSKNNLELSELFMKFFGILNIYILGYLSRRINIIIKLYFKRRRPFLKYDNILTDEKTRTKKENTYSFPSNSIQTSLIFYNILYTHILNFEDYKNMFLFLIIIIISLSKMNQGLHYPSDIIFSIVIFLFINFIYHIIFISIRILFGW